jgi:hypothetical protein
MAKATTVAPMPVPEKTVDVPATAPAKKKPSPSSEDKKRKGASAPAPAVEGAITKKQSSKLTVCVSAGSCFPASCFLRGLLLHATPVCLLALSYKAC